MLGSTNPSASYETLSFCCFETLQLVCGLNNQFHSSAVRRVRSTISSLTQQFDKETLKRRSTSSSTVCRDTNSIPGSEKKSQPFRDLFDGWTNGRTPLWIKEYIAFSPSRIAFSETHRHNRREEMLFGVVFFHGGHSSHGTPSESVPNRSSRGVFGYRCHHTALFSHWYPSPHPFLLTSG